MKSIWGGGKEGGRRGRSRESVEEGGKERRGGGGRGTYTDALANEELSGAGHHVGVCACKLGG